MKRILAILLLLLMLPLAAAQLEDQKEISQADMKFSATGSLRTVGNVKYINLKLFSFPKSDIFNTVLNVQTSPRAELKEESGEEFYYFIWDPDNIQQDLDTLKYKLNDERLEYSLTAEVKANFILPKVKEKIPFPYLALDKDLRPYTEATPKIDSNESNIKQLANKLASGEDDLYAVVFKFAKYVNNLLEYDRKYLEGTQKASKVLELKRGVCDEYTVLFMSLCRSVGIPVRYISGVAFSNIDDEFNPHSWAEVYFPDYGWIPFDPTYNEYGWVDATHIRLQETQNAEVPSIRYIWEKGDVEGEQPDIQIVMQDEKIGLPNILTSTMWVEKNTIGFDSYNIIWMQLENPNNYYIIPEVALAKSPEIISDNPQYVLLEPRGTELIHWIVRIPSDLDELYSYTYSVESKTMFAAPQKSSFIADKGADILKLSDINKKLKTDISSTAIPKPNLAINIHHPNKAYLDKPFELAVTAVNNGNSAIPDLKICVENECKGAYAGISEEIAKEFQITPTNIGENKIKLYFTGNGIDETHEITLQVKKQTVLDIIIDAIESLFG